MPVCVVCIKSVSAHFQSCSSTMSEDIGDTMDNAQLICEGQAHVYAPPNVFYNPVQEFNRDLTVAVITQFVREHFADLRVKQSQGKLKPPPERSSRDENGAAVPYGDEVIDSLDEPSEEGKCYAHGIRVLEALAASGLRSIRFGKEIPGIREIVSNDYNKSAVEYIKRNVEQNQLHHLVQPSHADASLLMYQNRSLKDRFDVVDLDPYGSPTPFIDAVVQSVKDGGLICITCTDMAILCGNTPEAARSKYGAMPLKAKYCHEMALRIVLQSVESQANRYSRYIVPVLSISVDFYVRVFVKVYTSQREVKNSVTKLSMVYHCLGCGAYTLQPLANRTATNGPEYKYTPAVAPPVGQLCKHCSHKHHIGGPVWSVAIHNVDFVEKVLQIIRESPEKFRTSERLEGVLSVVAEELPEVPLYYISNELSRILHCNAIRFLDFR